MWRFISFYYKVLFYFSHFHYIMENILTPSYVVRKMFFSIQAVVEISPPSPSLRIVSTPLCWRAVASLISWPRVQLVATGGCLRLLSLLARCSSPSSLLSLDSLSSLFLSHYLLCHPLHTLTFTRQHFNFLPFLPSSPSFLPPSLPPLHVSQ